MSFASMLSPAEAKRQRRVTDRERRAHIRAADRATLAKLRGQLRRAKTERSAALHSVVAQCRAGREQLRERVRALRVAARERVKLEIIELQESARGQCASDKRATLREVEAARRDLAEERHHQRALALAEGGAEARRLEGARKVPRAARITESDDRVRQDIPAELLLVWERVKHTISAGPRRSRTEAFLHWVHENPDRVLEIVGEEGEKRSKADIRKYTAELAEHERAMRLRAKSHPRDHRNPYEAAPF